MDFAATYTIPVWKSVRPWFKVEIYNLLNNQKQIAWDKTVTANPTARWTPTACRPATSRDRASARRPTTTSSPSRSWYERRPFVQDGIRTPLLT